MDNHDVVKKLVGKIQPQGESNTDEIRFSNLESMTKLITQLIQDVDRVAQENKDKQEYSMKKSGEFASKYLEEISEELSI